LRHCLQMRWLGGAARHGGLARELERIWREAETAGAVAAGCAFVTSRLGWEEPFDEMAARYTATIALNRKSAARRISEWSNFC